MKKIILSLLVSFVSTIFAANEYPVLSSSTLSQIELAKPSCRKIVSEGAQLSTGDFILVTFPAKALLYQVSFQESGFPGFKEPVLTFFQTDHQVRPTENIGFRTEADGTKIYYGFGDIGQRIHFQAQLKKGDLNWTTSISWGQNSYYGDPGSTTTVVEIKGYLPPIQFEVAKMEMKNGLPELTVSTTTSEIIIESSTDLSRWSPIPLTVAGIQAAESRMIVRPTPPSGGFGTRCFFRAVKK